MVEVIQADRDAAAELLALDLGEPLSPADLFQLNEIRTGLSDDDDGVQAFARHRADVLTTLQERVERLEAENERLGKAVCSGALKDLLSEDESSALLDFIQHLRSGSLSNAPNNSFPTIFEGK